MEEKNVFEKALDMCDFDIQVKFNYIDELLCDVGDELLDAYEDLAALEVDRDFNNRMLAEYGYSVERLSDIDCELYDVGQEIIGLERQQDILEDMYDEMFIGILANLD